jgi:hypothetical protein
MRSFLVGLHQATVGRDVTDNDGCETTRPYAAVRRRLVMISGSEVANFAHRGGTPPTTKAAPAYDFQTWPSVKAITSMKWGNAEAIAGIEFRKAIASRRLNLHDPHDD